MSANGTPNTSCRTNASRSAGLRGIEHHEQGQPDRLREQRLVFGVRILTQAHHRVRDMNRQFLPSRPPGAQHVQAYPPDNRGEPRLHVLDAPGILAANPEPGFLERIIGFAHRPEHPVGDRAQIRAMPLESAWTATVLLPVMVPLPRACCHVATSVAGRRAEEAQSQQFWQ
jgi:hypothetical protein